jgi:ABC-type branched-subunit amino acid transport system substrate-binding protein
MAYDWFTALPDVILATLAASDARARIKLGVLPPTGHEAWSREETRTTAYMALEGPDAAGGVLNQSFESVLVDDCGHPDQATELASLLAARAVPFAVAHQRSSAATLASSIYEHAGIGQARSRRKADVGRAAAIDAELATPGRI